MWNSQFQFDYIIIITYSDNNNKIKLYYTEQFLFILPSIMSNIQKLKSKPPLKTYVNTTLRVAKLLRLKIFGPFYIYH